MGGRGTATVNKEVRQSSCEAVTFKRDVKAYMLETGCWHKKEEKFGV